ncbi:MAG: hypothetical protein GXO29_01095 [Thermotogae bacterium]|nr:hypothetical protein [Thermotogota bacterium]
MLLLLLSGPDASSLARLRELERAFGEAQAITGVDSDLLKVISYRLTRFHRVGPSPKAEALPQYGVMGIFHIDEAVAVSGIPESKILEDDRAGILAGALLLKHYLDLCSGELVCALKMYAPEGAREIFARDILALYRSGLEFPILSTRAHPEVEIPKDLASEASEGLNACPPGPEFPEVEEWVPADPSNYTAANRPSDYPIYYIIIHTTEGTYYGAISWFQNSAANVSAHYVINSEYNSSDGAPLGEATQMVCHKDIAWHAGNWTYNTQSIGLEHEGYVSENGWYTDTLYRKSAYISRMASITFGFPADRDHIIGHVEVPGATHTDPGDYWDWAYYSVLVEGLPPADTIVDELSQGFRKYGPSQYWYYDSANGYGAYGHMWHTGSWNGVANWARWTPNLPYAGPYEVFAHIPVGADYDAHVPYIIVHEDGTDTVWVNQGLYSGEWVSLGTYNFAAGSYGYVILLDSSDISGDRIAFDAVKWSWRGGAVCGDLIVDDGDPGWTGFGTWTLSSYSGYNGDYRYATVGGTADSSVWYSPLGCYSGYKVWAWVRKGTNRSTSVHYRIYADVGPRDVYVSQYGESTDTGWIFLDSVCADTLHVVMYDDAPDGTVVIADAIMYELDTTISCPTTAKAERPEDVGGVVISYDDGYVLLKVPFVRDVRLEIFSVDGRSVLRRDLKGVVGWVKVPVRLSGGVYFVKVDDEVLKVVVR